MADSFSRTVGNGWGLAEAGGSWSLSPNAFWSVGNGTGRATVPVGTSAMAALPPLARDVDTTVTVSTDAPATGAGLVAEVLARRQFSGDDYRARLRFGADGAVRIGIVRHSLFGDEPVSWGEAVVPGVTSSPGQRMAIRFAVTGAAPTLLQATAWPAGGAAPVGWLAEGTSTAAALQRSGPWALGLTVPGGSAGRPVTWGVDDLFVGDGGTPGRWFGAPALGSAAYPTPADAIVVSPWGNDWASGTASAPLRTLGAAVARAPSGATIAMQSGVYPESVTWHDKRLTVQPIPGAHVWLTGADPVGGWASDGAAWRRDNWAPALSRTPHPEALGPSNSMAADPDMVFVDGAPLRQVANRWLVGPGTFYVDVARAQLFIGSNPAGHSVEASTRPYAVWLNHAHGSVIRGIGIERYATNLDQNGAVRAFADLVTLQDNVLRQNATAGIALIGRGSTIRNNTMSANGQIGALVESSSGITIDGNRFEGNNTEQFLDVYAEGAVKVTRSGDVTISRNLAENNYGRAFWIDEGSSGVRIVRNVIRNNAGRGVEYEISSYGVIASNQLDGNSGYGIYVLESAIVDVYNNTLVGDQEIKVGDGGRAPNLAAVAIRNNLTADPHPASTALLTVDDFARYRTSEQLGVSADFDHYRRPGASSPRYAVVWAAYPQPIRVFSTIDDFRWGTGQEQHGTGSEGSGDAWFVNRGANDDRLRIGAPVLGRAAGLPGSVAAALGLPAGTTIDPGAL